jgi:sugar lactone lactonase YvrE
MFNDFENGFLFKVNLTDNKVEKIGEGYGAADGLVMADNNLYLSDWKNGKVFKLDLSKEGSSPVVIKEGMEGSADMDVTPDGKYLVIPEMKANRVVIHSLD